VMYNSLESRNRADEASEARDLERL
jgi:hypothetical protein